MTAAPERKTPLGRWYGDPLSADESRRLLDQAERRAHRGGRRRRCRVCALQELIARYWLTGDINDDYRRLRQMMAPSAHGSALLELVYGQLLISRRLRAARPHLDEGFHRASGLLTPGDYLAVLKRHQQLAPLPLGDTPLPPATLRELLITAAVIGRLGGGARQQWNNDPSGI